MKREGQTAYYLRRARELFSALEDAFLKRHRDRLRVEKELADEAERYKANFGGTRLILFPRLKSD